METRVAPWVQVKYCGILEMEYEASLLENLLEMHQISTFGLQGARTVATRPG